MESAALAPSEHPTHPAEPAPIKLLRVLDHSLGYAEQVALAVALGTLIFVGAYQALMRNAFAKNPFWIDETIRYSVFFIGLLGGALAAQSDRLITIDMITRLLPVRGRLLLRIIGAIFTIGICVLLWKSSLLFRSVILDEKGEVMRPATALLALPVGAALIAVHLALHTIVDSYYLVLGRLPPELAEAGPAA